MMTALLVGIGIVVFSLLMAIVNMATVMRSDNEDTMERGFTIHFVSMGLFVIGMGTVACTIVLMIANYLSR